MKINKSTTLLILGWVYLGLSFIVDVESDINVFSIVALICFTFALVYSLEGKEK